MKLKEQLDGNYPVATALVVMCLTGKGIVHSGPIFHLCYLTDGYKFKIFNHGMDAIINEEHLVDATYQYVLNDKGGMIFVK